MNLRFQTDSTGALVPRRMSAQTALLVGHRILSRRAALEAALPDGHVGRGKALLAELAKEVALVHAGDQPPAPAVERPVPAAVRELLPDLEATAVGAVNHAVDNHMRAIADSVEGALRRLPGDPKRLAAEVLRGLLFAEGTGYLQLKSESQWMEVDRRLGRVDADAREAAATLGVDDLLEQLGDLNAWFGTLLGLVADDQTEPVEPPPAAQRPSHHDLLVTFTRLLSFAQNAWPEQDEAHAAQRLAWIGPYLEALAGKVLG